MQLCVGKVSNVMIPPTLWNDNQDQDDEGPCSRDHLCTPAP